MNVTWVCLLVALGCALLAACTAFGWFGVNVDFDGFLALSAAFFVAAHFAPGRGPSV
jgi:hypothetical protein